MSDPYRKNTPTETLTEAEATAIVNEAIDLDGRRVDRLTVAELEDRVEALGVPRARIREVMLERARPAKETEARAIEARKVRARRVATVLDYARSGGQWAAGVLGVFLLVEGATGATLSESRNTAFAAQERVYAALGRQQTTLLQVQTFTDPLNRDAEIAGAANRVSVAKNDYNAAASGYNSLASTFLGHNLVRVFNNTFPARLPFAREIWR